MDRFRAFLKFAGKGERKVLAVFATSPEGALRAVRYLRREQPDLPVLLFSVRPVPAEAAALCESVLVESDPIALVVEAQKRLWPDWVALSAATWTGDHFGWPVKLAPFLVPPGRALILNRHGDFVPGSPRNLRIHVRRLVRDALHSGWNRARDLARGYALWFFALLAQRFAPLSRRAFHRRHGAAPLDIPTPPADPGRDIAAPPDIPPADPGPDVAVFRYPHLRHGAAPPDIPIPPADPGRDTAVFPYAHHRHGAAPLDVPTPPADPGRDIAVFRYAHRHWDHAALEALIRKGTARFLLFLESGAEWDPADWVPLFDRPLTFAVSRQPAFRAWKPCLFPIAPFRELQPGEAAETAGPLSDAILVDRARLAALGLPKTVVPGTAWMLLFWKAAAAGWRSYSAGGSGALAEFPDWPYEDAEFVTRVLADPALRALGPRDPAMGRGAVAFHAARNRPSPPDGRLHVLLVSPYLPWPLSHGGAVRIWNLCRALREDVRFTLACFRESGDRIDYERLHQVFDQVYVVDRDQRPLRDPKLPAQVREHASEAMRALIRRICREQAVDLLQVEFTHLAHFRDAAPGVPAILVEHDLTFTLYRQYAAESGSRRARDEAQRWFDFESASLARYDAVWTMSPEDCARAIEAGARQDRTAVVANGVDLERFTPARDPAHPPEVLYIGSFRHRPNIIGFERLRAEIMPALWRRFPEARLRVVAGPDPEKHWTRPASLDPRIVLHGFVEDVRPLYARASAVAVPLAVSAGTNIKVMEAMACGQAVVSTPVGCQGLRLEDGADVLVRAGSPDFAEALAAVLADPALAAALGRRARATVEARFSWDAIAAEALASYRALHPAALPREPRP